MPLSFDGEWKVILPGGQEAKFSVGLREQERDIRYLYKIKVEKRGKKFVAVWMEKTDQLAEGESPSSGAHVDEDDEGPTRDEADRDSAANGSARDGKGNKRAKPWARRDGESEE